MTTQTPVPLWGAVGTVGYRRTLRRFRRPRENRVQVTQINPFVQAVGKVFSTMLDMTPQRCEVRVSKGVPGGTALTSIVGISGKLHGVVVLRFPRETSLSLANRMLGAEYAEVNDEVVDVAAELANMIGGAAKASFDFDPPLELGLPTVVQGSDYRVRYPSDAVWLEVPFESQAGRFTMEITFSTE